MVGIVHHATTKKAAALGFIISGSPEEAFYTVHWPERNKRIFSATAPQGVEDMKVLKMLILEHPQFRAHQDKKTHEWTLTQGQVLVARARSLEDAWDLANAADDEDEAPEEIAENDEDGDDFEGSDDEQRAAEGEVAEEEEEEAAEPRSVVKGKYKAKYKPTKQTCGDDLALRLKAHVEREDEETGEMKVSLDALRTFAEANGCWKREYALLRNANGSWNAGMARMNVANRLRAKVRKDTEFEVVWA